MRGVSKGEAGHRLRSLMVPMKFPYFGPIMLSGLTQLSNSWPLT